MTELLEIYNLILIMMFNFKWLDNSWKFCQLLILLNTIIIFMLIFEIVTLEFHDFDYPLPEEETCTKYQTKSLANF